MGPPYPWTSRPIHGLVALSMDGRLPQMGRNSSVVMTLVGGNIATDTTRVTLIEVRKFQ